MSRRKFTSNNSAPEIFLSSLSRSRFFLFPPPPLPRDSATRERFHSRILSRSRVFCVDGRLDDIFNDPIILSVFSRWWILIFVSREKKLARWAWLIWFIYNDYEMERNRNFHFYVFHGTFERQLKLGGGGETSLSLTNTSNYTSRNQWPITNFLFRPLNASRPRNKPDNFVD